MIEWRPVKGAEDRFEVSNTGLVRSLPNRLGPGKIKALVRSKLGYMYCYYHDYSTGQRVGKGFLVHRAVAQAFILNPESKPCVNHLDSDRSNNDATNLEWCTHAENVRHSIDFGHRDRYRTRGTGNGNAKLAPTQVVNVMHCRGAINGVALGRLYGVDGQTIRDIWGGRRWKHLFNNDAGRLAIEGGDI